MLFVVVSKQQKVGYFISKSRLHLCPTLSITGYVSAWRVSAARAGQLKKKDACRSGSAQTHAQPAPPCASVPRRHRLVMGVTAR